MVLLIYPNVAILITHPPELGKRPLDVVFIHAPLRFFLVLPLTIMFPYSLLYVNLQQTECGLTIHLSVTLGLTWKPSEPEHYTDHQWIGFAVFLAANLIGLIVIVSRSDIIWCVASVWINVAVWSTSPKPRPILVSGPHAFEWIVVNHTYRSLEFCLWYYTPLHLQAFCYGSSRWRSVREGSGFLKMVRREIRTMDRLYFEYTVL